MIAVIGSWHQACVLAAGFAELGEEVRQVVGDPAALGSLRSGRAPVHEPGLDELIAAGAAGGRLSYTDSYEEGLRGASHVLLAIDTPVGENDTSDLSGILLAAQAVAAAASGPFVLCVSSQVPIGTCDDIEQLVRGHSSEAIDVVYVPEFLRLGTALDTFRHADRFVIGTDDDDAWARARTLYARVGPPVLRTGRRSAEMGKHAANAFLATSISFINQIADLCEVTGADVTEVASILKLDRRIGSHAFLSAGTGYAGGTLGREITALRQIGAHNEVDTDLLRAVDSVNRARADHLLAHLRRVIPALAHARVAVLGLTYKAGTSTLRRSSALELIDRLRAAGAEVVAFDALARLDELPEPPPFAVLADPLDAAAGADAIVLMAAWPGFAELDLAGLARRARRPALVDANNLVDPTRARAAGLEYVGVGR